VCAPDDVPALARLMREADAAIRPGTVAQAARATAERFGMDAMAGQLVELYGKLNS